MRLNVVFGRGGFGRGLLVLLLVSSCGNGNSPPNLGVNGEYSINLEEQAKTILLNKAQLIQAGSSVSQVKAILGTPTEDKRLLGKKGEFRFRLLRYYIRKRDVLVNEKLDRYVSFYFDESDKLMQIGYKLDEGQENLR